MAISIPALSIFGGSESLGKVYREQSNVNIKFFEANFPLTGSGGKIMANLGGKDRLFILQGSHNGTGFTGSDQNDKLSNFVTQMDLWADSDGVQVSKTFTNSFGDSYNVVAVDWQWTRSFDDPFRVLYTLIMKRSAF